ncbi:uncharacterized protein LOC123317918 [Coccinella septempunctata]|uniref:uncharacterized protein LOC123317918 n=1 Tax=Coccinella septempunctata TaxID=41139 RepID=UPI001D09599A|nr:uncharacterized protein LOC123317918 [Coccinella septempunctata]
MGATDFSNAQKKYMESLFEKYGELIRDEMRREIGVLKEEINSYKIKVHRLEEENKNLKEKIQQMDKRSRRNNLIIYGIKSEGNNVEEETKKLLEDKLEINCPEEIIRDIYKLGKGELSPILLQAYNQKSIHRILNSAHKLKNSGVNLAPDYTPEEREARRTLVKRMREEKERGNQSYIRGNALIINNQKHTLEEIIAGEKERGGNREQNSASTSRATRSASQRSRQ